MQTVARIGTLVFHVDVPFKLTIVIEHLKAIPETIFG